MANRTDLQTTLETILGSRNVYFQPPESVKLKYPAIVYERDDIHKVNADNQLYFREHRYSVILIDKNPDSEFVDKLIALPKCSFSRHFVSDNLNHDVFELYY